MPIQNTNKFLSTNKVDKTYFDASLVIGTIIRINNEGLTLDQDASGNIGDIVIIDSSAYYKRSAIATPSHWVSWYCPDGSFN